MKFAKLPIVDDKPRYLATFYCETCHPDTQTWVDSFACNEEVNTLLEAHALACRIQHRCPRWQIRILQVKSMIPGFLLIEAVAMPEGSATVAKWAAMANWAAMSGAGCCDAGGTGDEPKILEVNKVYKGTDGWLKGLVFRVKMVDEERRIYTIKLSSAQRDLTDVTFEMMALTKPTEVQ
jgi:hypothetical protein